MDKYMQKGGTGQRGRVPPGGGNGSSLLLEDEVDGEDQADESRQMVPAQRFVSEDQQGEDREDGQRNHLLDHLQLEEREGASVVDEADAVGRHLAAVFEEGDAPAHQNDNEERQRIAGSHLVEFQVAVPGDGHEGVGTE